MSKTIKVLFLGDLVGRPGRESVQKFLQNAFYDDTKGVLGYDFVIANVENASHGFGLTKKNHDELISYGINCMTSGNHIWDKKDIYTFIDESDVLIRPLNYHKSARGVGYRVFNNKIVVINILGKTFMQPVVCPFQSLYDLTAKLEGEIGLRDKIVIVDYHAEATAEKICFAKFAKSLGVSAVFGTHTHVQTADEKIIEEETPGILQEFYKNGTAAVPKKSLAYITDVGFCGSSDSVIGMEYSGSVRRLVTSIPERFDVAVSDTRQINAVCAEFDSECGDALKIDRINFIYEDTKEPEKA